MKLHCFYDPLIALLLLPLWAQGFATTRTNRPHHKLSPMISHSSCTVGDGGLARNRCSPSRTIITNRDPGFRRHHHHRRRLTYMEMLHPKDSTAVGDINEREDKASSSIKDNLFETTLLLPSICVLLATVFCATPLPAQAAGAAAASGGVIPSALWAYVHYLSQLLVMGSLVAERLWIQPDMSTEQEQNIKKADWIYVSSLILLIVSGSLRTSEFGKGFDFYSHEILFWLKLSFVGVLVGCSVFPSITLFRRSMERNDSQPMSDKLIKRMTQVINAELSGIITIPLLATFMARGVTYINDFPWQLGFVFAILSSGGTCYFYGKQALAWNEDDDDKSKE